MISAYCVLRSFSGRQAGRRAGVARPLNNAVAPPPRGWSPGEGGGSGTGIQSKSDPTKG